MQSPAKLATSQGGSIVLSSDNTLIPDDGLACTADVCAGGVEQHVVFPEYSLIASVCHAAGTVSPSTCGQSATSTDSRPHRLLPR